MALNSHRLFTGSADAEHYLAALTIEKKREDKLRSARDICRDAIKSGLRNWAAVVEKSLLFERIVGDYAPSTLHPKFKMQGSFAYRTLNDPAQKPPQEIDLDDGIFVPVSFLNDNGGTHPALISAGYFSAIETLLAPVCKEHKWTLITDKSSCVRVKIDEEAHVDFALYAIPDGEFEELVENEVLLKSLHAQDRALLLEQVELGEDLYRGLREDQIMLAHRTEGWKPSDPRKLEDWFREAIRKHGEQLRRVSRYLKGWRDFRWSASKLSSISLMSCVVTVYGDIDLKSDENRDDRALLSVAQRLPGLLRSPIANPVVDGQYLDEGWTNEERSNYIQEAEALLARLEEAVGGTDSKAVALASLVNAFGERIPNDPSLLTAEETVALSRPAVLTSGLIKQLGSEQAPSEAVKREGDRRYG